MKTIHPTKKPSKSMLFVVDAHPAIDAALPAKPPMTIFHTLLLFNNIVYTTT